MVHTPKQLYSTARCWSAKRSPAAPSAADFADVTTCRLQLVRPHLTGAGARGAHIGSAECGHLGAAGCRDGRSARRRHGAMPVSPLLISCPCPAAWWCSDSGRQGDADGAHPQCWNACARTRRDHLPALWATPRALTRPRAGVGVAQESQRSPSGTLPLSVRINM
jgi:hypothetical protein